MKNKLLAIMSVIIIILVIFGVSERLSAKSPTQKDIEHRAVTGTEMEAAVVNGRISYQGYLTDPATGNPLTGTYNITFRLWDALSGGTQVGADIVKSNVAVADGLFNVTLDIPDETFDGQGRWIQIQVGGELLNPRREILPVPYALSLRPGALISGTVTEDFVFQGRNTATTGWSNGVEGKTDSSEGVGVLAINTGETGGNAINAWAGATSGFATGVFSESKSPEGYGVFGMNNAITGWATGVIGISKSPGGYGINGLNEATTGNAVGTYGESRSSTGIGVHGIAITTTGWTNGVMGDNYSTEGNGVIGKAHATSGSANGVYGESLSPNGEGVLGRNAAGGNGVWGSATTGSGIGGSSSSGSGVWGISTTGTGVGGFSTSGVGLWTRSVSGDLIVAYGSSDTDREFRVSNDGNVYADGTFHTGGADFAEMMPAHAGLEAGDVLIIGADGQLTLSVEAYQTAVVGVYSTAPGFLGGAAEDGDAGDNIPLAIVGIVPVKVSAENGPIQPGDLLTTSATPGYAMVCTNRIDCIGAIIGKALESWTEGSGVISVLVTLQ